MSDLLYDTKTLVSNVTRAINIAMTSHGASRSLPTMKTVPPVVQKALASSNSLTIHDFDDFANINSPAGGTMSSSCELLPSAPRSFKNINEVSDTTSTSSVGSGIEGSLNYLHSIYCKKDKLCDDCVREQGVFQEDSISCSEERTVIDNELDAITNAVMCIRDMDSDETRVKAFIEFYTIRISRLLTHR